ncbi:MAG TPA: ribosome silencing factor [Balneolaceae bacterium]|nr:ribosome silencing factor [Balneolaceae bacterium]
MPQASKSSKSNQQFTSVNDSSVADTEKLVDVIGEGLLSKQAEDITVLDVHNLTTLTDRFIVCHAATDVQIRAIANSVIEATSEALDEKPWQEEGRNARRWVILDYVNVVVHIFKKDLRKHYALEQMWSDAEISKIEDPEA